MKWPTEAWSQFGLGVVGEVEVDGALVAHTKLVGEDLRGVLEGDGVLLSMTPFRSRVLVGRRAVAFGVVVAMCPRKSRHC